MGHEKRIVEAFAYNKIERVLLIDDVYDMPVAAEITGDILEFMEGIDGLDACRDAGVADQDLQSAIEAVRDDDPNAEAFQDVMRALYVAYVETREDRFDPGGRFKTLKGLTLSILDPLIALLKKCGQDVSIQLSGILDGEDRFQAFKPQVVFLDYYLSPDATGNNVSAAVKTKARKASVELLSRLLKTRPVEEPAIVLMSSEQVKEKAQSFRQDVESLGENVMALRFRFLQKGWISGEANALKIEHEAADALLDTSQGYVFGKVLHQALKEWRFGAENAMAEVLKQIGSLEPKDFAYLFRFRLASEGERMGEYLEWLFGENLRAMVAENVNWESDAFKQIDDAELSKGIEGAFDGPSVPIARIFNRVRVDERPGASRRKMGDMFIKHSENKVMVVLTPDCDLVPRGTGPKAKRVLTMDGELRSFDQESASADQFIFYKKKAYSLKWNPKALQTFPIAGPGSLGTVKGAEFLGTLRPLYAQEAQRIALTDLGRIGLSVSPIMGVDAQVTAHLRKMDGNKITFEVLDIGQPATATVLPERGDAVKGHRVLLRRSSIHCLVDQLKSVDTSTLSPDDKAKLSDFLKEKNEDQLLSGFLIKGAATKDKGPLGTTIKIAARPDAGKDGVWLQFTLKLSDEAMEDLLSVDPTIILGEE